VIATATDVRLPLAELAGAKLWPVYVEKPLATRAADVAPVFDALAPVADAASPAS
jgi:predicted dehydrogenase